MVPVTTTPDTQRSKWPLRPFRLDDQRWSSVIIKLAQIGRKWQYVAETMVLDWLAGNYDVEARREELKKQGILPD